MIVYLYFWHPFYLIFFCVYTLFVSLNFCLTFQVHIADGIQYVREIANSVEANEVSAFHGNGDTSCTSNYPANENCMSYHVEGRGTTKVDIVIIDVDSSDSR